MNIFDLEQQYTVEENGSSLDPFKAYENINTDGVMLTNSDAGPVSYFKPRATSSNGEDIINDDWALSSFVLKGEGPGIEPLDAANRAWSRASIKFADSRFGCNIGINQLSQFTPYADWPDAGRLKSVRREPSIYLSGPDDTVHGLGAFWSEMFDDTAQIVYIRPGVPEFQSMLNYLRNAFDYRSSVYARTGRAPSFTYELGKFFTGYVMLTAVPWPARILYVAGKAALALFARRKSQYYNVRPTPHMFWGQVNMVIAQLAFNEGLLPSIPEDIFAKNPSHTAKRLGMGHTFDEKDIAILRGFAKDLITEEGFFDAYAFATRHQRMANAVLDDEFKRSKAELDPKSYVGWLKKDLTGQTSHDTEFYTLEGKRKFWESLSRHLHFEEYTHAPDLTVPQAANQNSKSLNVTNKDFHEKFYEIDGKPKKNVMAESWWEEYKSAMNAQFNEGGDWVIFRVENTGAVSDSFQNQSSVPSIAGMINSNSASWIDKRFTLGEGAILPDVVKGIASMVFDGVAGAAETLTFGASNILGMFGDGFVAFPEYWSGSSASLSSFNYKISLETPYSNTISRLFKLYFPVAALLALFLPKATGRHSYGSPYVCEVFDQGRGQTRLALPESLTISRGGGSLGFTPTKKVTRLDITLRFKDLTPVVALPTFPGPIDYFIESTTDAMQDEESGISNYLAALSGQSLYDQIYGGPRFRLRWAKFLHALHVGQSPHYWASATRATMKESFFLGPVMSVIETVSRGNEAVISGAPSTNKGQHGAK